VYVEEAMGERQGALVSRLTFVATLGGLLFGYDTAVISGAVGAIDANFIDPLQLSETARSSLSGWTISSALLGCVIGAAVAGLDPKPPPGRQELAETIVARHCRH
jgi:MFS transporter, SP family, xylose:H+ symportor